MTNDIILQVSNLSKAYKLYSNKSDRLKEALSLTNKQYSQLFYAIKDISFYPIILPDFSFEEIKGFLNPNITGFKINDKYKLNEFKDNLIKYFNLQELNYNIWEQDRDTFISRLNNINVANL